MTYDGQGIDFYSQGLPGPVEAVNAPSSTDADAMLALATPTVIQGGPMIDLEYQLPPDVQGIVDCGDGQQENRHGLGSQIIVGIIVALLTALIVR